MRGGSSPLARTETKRLVKKMIERPIIIEDHFSNWDKQVGRTVVRSIISSKGFVVSTIATRHSPLTVKTDFETMVYDFLGYEDGTPPKPQFDTDNENEQFGLNIRLMESDGATIESAREYHYQSVDKLASIMETGNE